MVEPVSTYWCCSWVLLIGTASDAIPEVLPGGNALINAPLSRLLRQKRSHKRRKAFDYMAISLRLSSGLRSVLVCPVL
ncbi:hypothetical protein, partial [Bordetella pertussis]|uniref:hypothetical protein n=1 Tax=Bordetella pertussis TaxID=520 RepID=UPI001D0BAB03